MESFQKEIENCLKMKEQEQRCACTRKDDDLEVINLKNEWKIKLFKEVRYEQRIIIFF